MNFLIVAADYPERENFTLIREDIGEIYIFIHFQTPVTAILRGEKVDISPGGCVFFGMNSRQHFFSKGALMHDWFHADEGCGEMMERFGIECERVYYPKDSESITRIISSIELEYINRNKHYKEAVDSLAASLFVALSRAEFYKRDITPVDIYQREQFINARREIHTQMLKQWTVKDMAELVCLSESRFYYLYKKIFGISPQKDLMRKRIQTAQAMLINEKISVQKCAELTGYTNQYHFIRQFKSLTGTTPGKVKKALIYSKK